MIERARAEALVRCFSRQRILVLGDLMLDRYIRGHAERLSPEAPVPIVRVAEVSIMPGGAANVAVNIRALGGEAVVAGFVGCDKAGDELLELLECRGLSTAGVIRLRDRCTTEKTRIIAERQQVVRVDQEHDQPVRREDLERLASRLSKAIRGCTGAILEDYGKGAIRQPVVDALLHAAELLRIPTGYDPKEDRDLRVRPVTLATPNCREAHVCAGLPPRSEVEDPLKDRELAHAVRILKAKWQTEALVVTLGPKGMVIAEQRRPLIHLPTRAREVFDVSGAGDTVIATCLLARSAGATALEAASLGNHAAGVVVGKLGTASCSPEELLLTIRNDQGGVS